MKKKMIFSGTATAIVTPFKHGVIDYSALANLIQMQIESGINALVVGGTTGEASTLSDYERDKLYYRTAELVSGRVPLIFGTGSNDTKKALKYTKRAKSFGADASLIVTPYYNKGTDEGIVLHYKKIANSVDLPIILYNVPSRTGVNLSIDAIKRLSEEENISAIKEASGSLDRLCELSNLSKRISFYAGNDSEIYTTLSLGGMGAISVLSNVCPCEVLAITDAFWRGDENAALRAQKKILPKIRALFRETNPAPIKYAMKLLGLCESEMRLPLTDPSRKTKNELEELFGKGTA